MTNSDLQICSYSTTPETVGLSVSVAEINRKLKEYARTRDASYK